MDDPKQTDEFRPGSRDSKGRFLPGNPGGPGRPRGYDLLTAAREEAEREGVDLHQAVGRVVLALLRQAERGDVQAARLVLDRLAGPIERGPLVAIDARAPEPPAAHAEFLSDPGRVAEWARRLVDLTEGAALGKREKAPQDPPESTSSEDAAQ